MLQFQHILLILFIFIITSQHCHATLVPLHRLANYTATYDDEWKEFSYAPYTVNVATGKSSSVTLIIDSTSALTFLSCCVNGFTNKNTCVDMSCKDYGCDYENDDNILCRRHEFYYPLSSITPVPNDPASTSSIRTVFLSIQQAAETVDYLSLGNGKYFTTENNKTHLYIASAKTRFYNSAHGALGLGISPFVVSFYNMFLSQYEPGKRQFALDLFHADYKTRTNQSVDGYMILGKDAISSYEPFQNSPILWSERQYRLNSFLFQSQDQYLFDVEYAFSIYKLKLCGALLLSNYSSVWQAQVNTLIDGIGLPEPYFYMVKEWLNDHNYDAWSEATIKKLPSLSFSLTDDDDDDNDNVDEKTINKKKNKIEIPLSAVFEQVKGLKQFHIYNKGPVKYFGRISIMRAYPTIDLGTRVLQHLYAVFDLDKYKVGLVQKQRFTSSTSNNMCKVKPTCIGSQTYYEPMNMCLDPECYSYYFQTVDSTTRTCKMRLEFYFIFVTAMVVFIILEVLVFEVHTKLSSYLSRLAVNNNVNKNNNL